MRRCFPVRPESRRPICLTYPEHTCAPFFSWSHFLMEHPYPFFLKMLQPETVHEVRRSLPPLLARVAAGPPRRASVAGPRGARGRVAVAGRACLGLGHCGCGHRLALLAPLAGGPAPVEGGGSPCSWRSGGTEARLECHRAGSVGRRAYDRG